MFSFGAYKLLLYQYFDIIKFSMNMALYFPQLIFYYIAITTFCICGQTTEYPPKCTICLQVLTGDYYMDAWKNPFHIHHENEGIFCNSCSRIISQGITHGGYRYNDGRHICSLCQISVVKDDSSIYAAYSHVITLFKTIGINNIPSKIPIELINLIELNNKIGSHSYGNLKGFTHTDHDHKKQPLYTIFMLFGLPKIEFEGALAHELMHVWLYENYPNLQIETTEGLCNLGSAFIYKNDGTHFSKIHLQAMENDPHTIYGNGYRKMKALLKKSNWSTLLSNLNSIK